MYKTFIFLINTLILLCSCTENSTTEPNDMIPNKSITFISNRDANPELYIMLSDGSQQKRITHSGGYERDPVWDHRKENIAYYLMENGHEGIYIIDPELLDSTKIVDSWSLYGNINWNNTGTSICFDTYQSRLHSVIGLINVNTASTSYITPDSIFQEYSPSWSFDGNRVAFISKDSLLNSTNRLVTCLQNGQGREIIYESSGVIYYPLFSTNSNLLAFYEKIGSLEKFKIRLFNLDNNSINTIYDSAYIHPNISNEYRLEWSPDGSKIAFISGGENSEDICTIKKDGSDFINLTNDNYSNTAPHWSEDGKEIVFVSNRSGSKQIFSVDTDSQVIKQLTFSSGENYSPNW
jgi:TolB protein